MDTTLNAQQKEAVLHIGSPLLILAGAGTGKTTVLVNKIAYLVNEQSIMPYNILAVTFTNKAAREMKARTMNITGNSIDFPWIGTFHSIATKILRQNKYYAGLEDNFIIVDVDDQIRLIKQIVNDIGLDPKEHSPKDIANQIQKFKDKYWSPEQVPNYAINSRLADGRIVEIYQEYNQRLRNLNAVDFGDLLLLNIKIFIEKPEILKIYNNQFQFILVDEYQDTNVAQYLWLRLISKGNDNICCVGDDDQSIYGWRGAEIENILSFTNNFKNSKIIKLEQNYRSNINILGAASSLIKKNTSRHNKTLWSEINSDNKVNIISYDNNFDESRGIVNLIKDLTSKNNSDKNAILVRAMYQTRVIESELLNQCIPYKIYGGLRFYERKEIKDIIAYIRLLMSFNDNLALERIINIPKRGIGNSTMQKIINYSRYKSISMFYSIKEMLEQGVFKGKTQVNLYKFIEDFEGWNKNKNNIHHAKLVNDILEESGYLSMLSEDNSNESEARIENLKELINNLDDFNDLSEFIEHVSLINDNENQNEEENNILIMTLHASKGLEFDNVILPGWEESIFPSQKSINEKHEKGLEEERRLAYVGITRAKKNVFITHALARKNFGSESRNEISRFVNDIDQKFVNIVSNRRINKKKVVMHKKFGYGVLLSSYRDELTIRFHNNEVKKIMREYITFIN